MRAIKVLVFGAIGLALVATVVFYFFPKTRPALVKKWFRTAEGFTAAKTPNEALDKFRDAIKKRDYETAATYCGGDYAEQDRLVVHCSAPLPFPYPRPRAVPQPRTVASIGVFNTEYEC